MPTVPLRPDCAGELFAALLPFALVSAERPPQGVDPDAWREAVPTARKAALAAPRKMERAP